MQRLKNFDDYTSMLTDMEVNHKKAIDITESAHAYEVTELQMELSECRNLQDYLNNQLCRTRKELATVQQDYAHNTEEVERLQLGFETLGKDTRAMIESGQSSQRQLASERALAHNELDKVIRQLKATEAVDSRQTQAQENLLEAGRTEIARLRQHADEQYESLEQAEEDKNTLQSSITQLCQEANAQLDEMRKDHDGIIEEMKNCLNEQLEKARLRLEEAECTEA